MTDELTPAMLRDFVQLLDRCTNRYQFNSAKEFIRNEAARREAEQNDEALIDAFGDAVNTYTYEDRTYPEIAKNAEIREPRALKKEPTNG